MNLQNSKENEELTKKIQKKELSMLISLQKILEEHRIPFYLACGTALGCVRHGGYIPWDDDVDLYVRGRDLPKLKEVFRNSDTGTLALHDFDTVENYPYWFPKIVSADTVLIERKLQHLSYKCGVYIDIFPLAETPDSPFLRFFTEKKRKFYYFIVRMTYLKQGSKLRSIVSTLVKKCFSEEKAKEKLYRQYTKERKGKKYLIDGGTFGKQALLSRADFETPVNMPFEEGSMPMPTNFEHYLKGYYGDYMKLPPEEERVSGHEFATLIME